MRRRCRGRAYHCSASAVRRWRSACGALRSCGLRPRSTGEQTRPRHCQSNACCLFAVWLALFLAPGCSRAPHPSGPGLVFERVRTLEAAGRQALRRPVYVAAGAHGVYITDIEAHRVFRFSFAGKLEGSYGGIGQGPNDLFRLAGVAVGLDGAVLVADAGNHRIVVLDPELKRARLIRVPFPAPATLASAPLGGFFVSAGDTSDVPLPVYQCDSSGRVLREVIGPNVARLASDRRGHLWVAGMYTHSDPLVHEFGPDGKHVRTLGWTTTASLDPGGVYIVGGLAVDATSSRRSGTSVCAVATGGRRLGGLRQDDPGHRPCSGRERQCGSALRIPLREPGAVLRCCRRLRLAE